MKLTNADIWGARNLMSSEGVLRDPLRELIEHKFPVKVSYELVQLANKLEEPFKVVTETRVGLIRKHGKADGKGQFVINREDEAFPQYTEEFIELLNQEVKVDFNKVTLPGTVAATCDKCNHNMDKPFEIEPFVLMALWKFVEVS